MLFLVILLFIGSFVTGSKFDPYVDNGGTVVGLAGKDFVILAADTRLSDQYTIRSRSITRIFEVDDGLLFSGSGCWSDTLALSKELKLAAQTYEWEHKNKLRIRPLSYLLSSQLYSKRFFPYYTFCMVAGLDSEGMRCRFLFRSNLLYICAYNRIYTLGSGSVHRYDAVGSMERVAAVCTGKAEHLIQPLLDEVTNMEQDDSLWELSADGENAFISSTRTASARSTPKSNGSNDAIGSGDSICMVHKCGHCCTDLSCAQACEVVRRAFCAAAEREITVGDGLDIWVLKRNKIRDFGTPTTDSTEYILEKQHYTLPRH